MLSTSKITTKYTYMVADCDTKAWKAIFMYTTTTFHFMSTESINDVLQIVATTTAQSVAAKLSPLLL